MRLCLLYRKSFSIKNLSFIPLRKITLNWLESKEKRLIKSGKIWIITNMLHYKISKMQIYQSTDYYNSKGKRLLRRDRFY
jgi:hypothetical protein